MLPVLRRYLAVSSAVGIAVAGVQAALIWSVVVGHREAVDRRVGEISLAVQASLLEDELEAKRSWPEIEGRLRARLAALAADDEMAVYDEAGQLLARSSGQLTAVPPSLPLEARKRLDGDVRPLEPGNPVGVIAVGTAREIAGQKLYLVRVNVTLHNEMPAALRLSVGALVAPILLLGLAGAFAIARMTERQLSKVDRTLRQLAGGDLSARMSLPVDEETAAVVLSFNRMAEKVERTIEKLRYSDESRRQLLADVTHELNTPLTSVIGYLETLCMADMPLTPEKRASLTRVAYDEAVRLRALIEDLATLSRLDAEGLPLERRRVALDQVVERVVRRLSPLADARGVPLKMEIGGETAGLEVDGDPQRLDQVVRNLVENALRHTAPPGDVTVIARRAGDRAVIEVVDHGSGIRPEDLPRLGQRFFRLDRSRARHTGGRGLGLAISVGLVEAHGGKVQFESKLGSGTTVRVMLPLPEPRHEEPPGPDLSVAITNRLSRTMLPSFDDEPPPPDPNDARAGEPATEKPTTNRFIKPPPE